jgi:hypothetical protein
MPECVSAAVSSAGSRTWGSGGYVLLIDAEVHFEKALDRGMGGAAALL